MSRGKAEFSTMDIGIEVKPGSEPHRTDEKDCLPRRIGDPMRNLLDKNIEKGFTRQAPPSNNGVETMRGHAEFVTMKDFGDYEMKGSATESTAEQASGTDVAAGEKLSDKANKKGSPKGGIRVNDDDLTMSDDLKAVEDGAKRDIESGYVQDIQGEKVGKKGYQAYNEMCCKGMAADLNINPYDVAGSMAQIADSAEMVVKELDGGIEVKESPKMDAVRAGLKTAWDWGKGKVAGAGEAIGERLGKVGSKVEEGLRNRGIKRTQQRGHSAGTRSREMADWVRSNKKKVGAGVVGAGALGAGAVGYGGYRGAKALLGNKEDKGFDTEEKCMGEGPMARKKKVMMGK